MQIIGTAAFTHPLVGPPIRQEESCMCGPFSALHGSQDWGDGGPATGEAVVGDAAWKCQRASPQCGPGHGESDGARLVWRLSLSAPHSPPTTRRGPPNDGCRSKKRFFQLHNIVALGLTSLSSPRGIGPRRRQRLTIFPARSRDRVCPRPRPGFRRL